MNRSIAEELAAYRIEVVGEVAALDAQIVPLNERRAAKLREVEALDRLLELVNPAAITREGPTAQSPPGILGGMSIGDAAYKALAELGHPAHYVKLCEHMTSRGAVVPGKNPPANLIAHISKDARFRRVARGTYGLSEWKRGRTRAS